MKHYCLTNPHNGNSVGSTWQCDHPASETEFNPTLEAMAASQSITQRKNRYIMQEHCEHSS